MDRSNYEKITDDVMVIANRVVLRMNVGLVHYTSENKRVGFHKEIEYYSQKANMNVRNIRRNFDYYLSIEHIINKDYIRIGVTEMMKVQYALHKAYKFFIDDEYSNLYAKTNDDLILYKKVDPIIVTGLPQEKFLQFEPSIYTDFRGHPQQGLRMYLSSMESYCDIPVNRLEGFMHTMDTISLFQLAQNMINYIERPDFGTNLYSCITEPTDEELEASFQGQEGRKVQPNKSLSYFDKMRNLED